MGEEASGNDEQKGEGLQGPTLKPGCPVAKARTLVFTHAETRSC